MNKNPAQVWELVEDLSDDELATLGNLIAGMDRLEMVDEAPRYAVDEISLIGRFQDLEDEPEDDESDEGAETATTNDTGEFEDVPAERNFQENSFAPES